MGLLGKYAQQPQQAGGLLGGLSGGAPSPAGNQGLQMAQQLAQNPTPQMAQQIVQQMQQKGPEGAQMAQVLMQISDDPESLTQFANSIIQKIQGGGA